MALPKPDPLKPQPGRREPGARSVRGPKLAEDLTVTPAAHTLDGHTGSLTKSRLNSTTLVEEGNGVPTHTAERSTQYQDLDTNKVYINADGATTWVEIGTGAGSGYSTIQDEGSALTQRTTVDFVGAGVTATDTGAKTEVNIPGGGVTDHGALTGLGDPDHSAYLPLAGGTMSGDLDMDTNDIINARTVEIKDTDGTPVNDVLLRVINEVLEIRNTADSAFRNLSVDDFIVGGEVIRIKASGGTLSLRNYADTAYGGLIALLVQTDTLVERTAAAGVTIDGLLIKDNGLTFPKVTTANIDANDEIVLPTAAWVYITCSAASDSLAGIGAGAEGQLLFLTPAAGKDITLVHNGTVVAGKKLMLNGEANYVMDQDHDFVIAIYDATATVWNVLVPGSAGGSALTVQEEDGTPIDTAVTIIRVPNGGLTDNGTGDVSLGYELAGAVTTHAGAADPHTGYRLESANHSHISTGLQAGQLTVAALSDAPAGELGGTWASPTVDANHAAGVYHEFDEIAAPGAGSANKLRVYAVDVAGVTALGLVDSAGVAVAIRPVDWTDLTDGGATTLHSHAVMVQTVNFVIDGGGSAITTGVKGDLVIDYACTINSATLLADQSGSIVIDIWKDTYANFPPTVADTITASAKPTLSGAQKSQDTTLTGWTTSIAAGETLRFNVDSVATVQRVTLSLKVTRT